MKTNNNELSKKIEILRKMIESGIKTEKDVTNLDFDVLLHDENVTKEDMMIMIDIKKSLEEERLYSYLSGVKRAKTKRTIKKSDEPVDYDPDDK